MVAGSVSNTASAFPTMRSNYVSIPPQFASSSHSSVHQSASAGTSGSTSQLMAEPPFRVATPRPRLAGTIRDGPPQYAVVLRPMADIGQGPTKTTLARSLVELPFDHPQLRTSAGGSTHSTVPSNPAVQHARHAPLDPPALPAQLGNEPRRPSIVADARHPLGRYRFSFADPTGL
jgi:hypothetical protein